MSDIQFIPPKGYVLLGKVEIWKCDACELEWPEDLQPLTCAQCGGKLTHETRFEIRPEKPQPKEPEPEPLVIDIRYI